MQRYEVFFEMDDSIFYLIYQFVFLEGAGEGGGKGSVGNIKQLIFS